jgi:hypothetical protein
MPALVRNKDKLIMMVDSLAYRAWRAVDRLSARVRELSWRPRYIAASREVVLGLGTGGEEGLAWVSRESGAAGNGTERKTKQKGKYAKERSDGK